MKSSEIDTTMTPERRERLKKELGYLLEYAIPGAEKHLQEKLDLYAAIFEALASAEMMDGMKAGAA